MTAKSDPIRVRASTPKGVPGAIACIEVTAPDGEALAEFARAAGLPLPAPESLCHSDLLGIDEGLVLRTSDVTATLTPHGSPLGIERLLHACAAAGAVRVDQEPLQRVQYPEAGDAIEALALETLAAAASPLAVDLLLGQIPLWRSGAPELQPDVQRSLSRLLTPPSVVAIGPANVGKSTLLNRLAQHALAVVDNTPGTTRDHVSARIDCGGLTLMWTDTPGRRPDADHIESEAQRVTARLLDEANLVLNCGESGSGWITPPTGKETLRVGMRCDVQESPGAEVHCSHAPGGTKSLARRVRELLVPDEALLAARTGRWRFHEALTGL